MAAAQQLQVEASCSVCGEYFKEPVSISCGHNFCRACLELCWSQGNFLCPQCQEAIPERTFRPNRELGNMVELLKNLELDAAAEASPVAKGVCARHQEPLKLFCQEDQTPICVICRESRDHRSHQVLPIEEAAENYKERIWADLQQLKRVKEYLTEMKLQDQIKQHLDKIEMERDVVVKEFDQLHQFEQEQKSLLLDQLKELQKEVEEEQKSKAENADNLDALIRDMEAIYQQSDNNFLQDIKNTLSRSKDFQMPVNAFSFTPKLAAFSQKNAALKVTLINLKETFTSELKNHEKLQAGHPFFYTTQQAHPSMTPYFSTPPMYPVYTEKKHKLFNIKKPFN
ncbi:zinc finger protein RFP-like [Paroedura picta]|uniref:zinc finger protein RFP-like n=1 Tax=Paroedura picta TaxID=143630 RepID=UPI0040570356